MKNLYSWLFIISIIGITMWLALDYNGNFFRLFNFNHTVQEDIIPENEWKVVQQADSTEMIRVEWDQKYGETKTAYCRVIFQNNSQYKLVAPWVTLTIEKTNLNNINFSKESYDSIKIEYSRKI